MSNSGTSDRSALAHVRPRRTLAPFEGASSPKLVWGNPLYLAAIHERALCSMNHIFPVLLIVCTAAVQAQPAIQWQKCYGGTSTEKAFAMQPTTDGGYVLTGYTESWDGDVTMNHGLYDLWVVKVDSVGDLQWQRSLGGTRYDRAAAIQQTSDGGYIVAGITDSNDGDVSGNHSTNQYDAWVVKLNASGGIQWQKCLGGTNGDQAEDISQTTDGGYLLAGITMSLDGDASGGHGLQDGWLVKLGATGNIEWQKCLGGTNGDWVNSVLQTSDGGYIATGTTQSNDGDVFGGHGDNDAWVVKLDATGNIQWQKCLGGTGSEQAYSTLQTSDGGYILVGTASSNDWDVSGNHGSGDCWVVKLDGAGNMQWQKCLGGTDADFALAVQQATDGGYLVAGQVGSSDGDASGHHGMVDGWLVKLDDLGALEWQRCLGGSGLEALQDIEQITDGVYVVAGQTGSHDGDVSGVHGPNYEDFWLVKLGLADLGIEDPQPLDFSLAPNPAHTEVHVRSAVPIARLELVDPAGRRMSTMLSPKANSALDVSTLTNGLYIAHVVLVDGRTITETVMVAH